MDGERRRNAVEVLGLAYFCVLGGLFSIPW